MQYWPCGSGDHVRSQDPGCDSGKRPRPWVVCVRSGSVFAILSCACVCEHLAPSLFLSQSHTHIFSPFQPLSKYARAPECVSACVRARVRECVSARARAWVRGFMGASVREGVRV
eukprot:6020445-Pleurochrysis_carterae.AAC.3